MMAIFLARLVAATPGPDVNVFTSALTSPPRDDRCEHVHFPRGTMDAPGTKGEATRSRLLGVALELFAERGFGGTTMRDLADAAGLSQGATYRHFAHKEDLVLALYARLAATLEEQVVLLPPGSLATRFCAAMELKLGLLAPHRRAFAALAGVALDPDAALGVLGDDAANVRARVRRAFERVLAGASDAPAARDQAALVSLLYGVHLLLILVWLQDRSAGAPSVRAALTLVRQGLSAAGPFLSLPPVRAGLRKIEAILKPLLGSAP